VKTSEALTSIAQTILRFRGADAIAPDLGTISRTVRQCAPLVKADASDQTSAIIELALHYIRAHDPRDVLG
jgi:hypothetical protein